MKNEESSLSPNTDNIQQQQHYRLQLLAQAIEKVESECSQKQLTTPISIPKKQHQIPIDSLSMASSQQQELLMQLFAQPNVAAVMAAAAAAAQYQAQQQHRKHEPISPPSTSSASSTAESPIDFSSHRSNDDMNECSSPPPSQQLFPSMLQNIQSSTHFPFLLTNKNGKPTRPFKAYPREPLMLPLGFCSNTTSEQANILAEAASRATPNRKRLAQTQERLKQRIQQQQQQQLLSTTHFISSSGAQILQPPKKRHRMMENALADQEKPPVKDNNNNESDGGVKDDAYWERRRKNNEAAKRSRDARRAKEDEIALR
jgi:bZIP factor